MLVLWSGGCDSTLMLHDLALANHAHSQVKPRLAGDKVLEAPYSSPVRAISFSCHQIEGGGAASKKARTKIIGVLRKKGLTIDHTEVAVSYQGDAQMLCGNGGCAQAPIWLVYAQLFLEVDEDLYLGYIRGDDIWHHKSELHWVFQYCQSVIGKTGKLYTPLEWDRKCDVQKRLAEIELLDLCWYCEMKSDKPCGECPACVTHKAGLAIMGTQAPGDFQDKHKHETEVKSKVPKKLKPLAKRRTCK